MAAPIFAQNPEFFPPGGDSLYRPAVCEAVIDSVGGWLPEEWSWYRTQGGTVAVNCGVFGGTHTGFIAHYADQAISLIREPRNQSAWSLLDSGIGDAIMVEQYFLSACIEYHRIKENSLYPEIGVEYLFRSFDDAFDEQMAKSLGYTHLINGAKRNRALARRLENRVRKDYPELYERCVRITTPRRRK
jgi:hypothetical protein